MAWGGGWGNRPAQSAEDVAKAFYAGKRLQRSSCRTDGETYWFVTEGRQLAIARRVRDEDRLDQITLALNGAIYQHPLAFNTCGWRSQTTARHFCALGLKAECFGIKRPQFWVNGRLMPDSFSGWFTPEMILAWPTEHPDDVTKRARRQQLDAARQYRMGREFVQTTLPLPFWRAYA
jgi:hypothetical protein